MAVLLASLLSGVAAWSPFQHAALELQANDEPDATTALTEFEASYVLNGTTFTMRGFEPAGEQRLPLYVLVGGQQTMIRGDPAELRIVQEMAARGFAAAYIEVPGNPNRQVAPISTEEAGREMRMQCDGSIGLTGLAEAVFTYPAQDGQDRGALSFLCARARIDCSLGLALHGISLGGLLVSVAPRFATGVTATLVFAAGNIIPGGRTCCGRLSGNTTCCAPGSPVGGDPLTCERDSERALHLSRSRRRLILGENDMYYADCDYQTMTCDSTPTQVRRQGAMGSGYDCGEEDDCIQADGSGYYIPRIAEMDPVTADRTPQQGHMFIREKNAECAGTATCGYTHGINPAFVETDAAWGLRANVAWLATAARRPLADALPIRISRL